MQFTAYASGIATLVLFWILYRLFAGTWDLGKIYEGADGKPSTSKLQWFLWTVVVIFAYVVVYAARIYKGNFEAITEIPENLLIAMGISITSMVAAKGITVAQMTSGQSTKLQSAVAGAQGDAPNQPSTGGVFKDDSGVPDLSKIQIMAWTLIAIGTYLIRLFQDVNAAAGLPSGASFNLDLPDIDQALMVLMGLGHGAYLGKKLVTTTTPRLTGVAPGQGPSGTPVTLTGIAFGATQDGNLLTIDGMPIYPQGLTWGDTQITFQIPATHPGGTPWGQGQRILIGVMVNGQQSANTLPFTVTAGGLNGGGNAPPPPNPQPVAPPPVNPQQPDNPGPAVDSALVNPQITDDTGGAPPVEDANRTAVNSQITDAVTQTVNPQITDAVTQTGAGASS